MTTRNTEQATHIVDKIEYDENKFKELILYIADQMGNSDTFGATMFNKVLFFADFYHYAEHGVPITGAEYQRLDHGPAPKRLLPAIDELIQEKKASIRTTPMGPYTRRRLKALVEPDLQKFSATEIKQVDEVIKLLGGRTAGQVSNISRDMIGWKAADTNETIPYYTVFLTKTGITDSDRSVAKGLKQNLVVSAAA